MNTKIAETHRTVGFFSPDGSGFLYEPKVSNKDKKEHNVKWYPEKIKK